MQLVLVKYCFRVWKQILFWTIHKVVPLFSLDDLFAMLPSHWGIWASWKGVQTFGCLCTKIFSLCIPPTTNANPSAGTSRQLQRTNTFSVTRLWALWIIKKKEWDCFRSARVCIYVLVWWFCGKRQTDFLCTYLKKKYQSVFIRLR